MLNKKGIILIAIFTTIYLTIITLNTQLIETIITPAYMTTILLIIVITS